MLFLRLLKRYASLMSKYVLSGQNFQEQHLFALVNNFDELALKVVAEQDVLFPEEGDMDWKNLSVADRKDVQEKFDEVEHEFHELGKKCLDIIVDKTVKDYLLDVFNPTWLSHSNKENMQNVVATIEECFAEWEENLATVLLITRMKERVCERIVDCY